MTSTISRVLSALFLVALASIAPANAASKANIDRKVDNALDEFREQISGAEGLLKRAEGVLVFPSVKKAGFAVGGEYGEGALRIGDKTVAYYSTAAGSFGFQIGVQSRRQMLVFLEKSALEKFRASENWEIGVDGSVTVITLDAGGEINTKSINQPVVAFIFDSKGLMYNLSLEGSKITRIHNDD